LLGFIILAPEFYADLTSRIQPDDFYVIRHRSIGEAILQLTAQGIQFEYVTVSNTLQTKGWVIQVGGDAYLIQLAKETPTYMHTESIARIVKEKECKRSVAGLSLKVAQSAHSEKPLEDLQKHMGDLIASCSGFSGNTKWLVFSAEQLCSSDVGELTWVPKNWIMAGGIILIADMLAAGKSILALDLAIGMVSNGITLHNQPVVKGMAFYHFLDGSYRVMRSRVLKLCNARGIHHHPI
jgi:hypothetical protein